MTFNICTQSTLNSADSVYSCVPLHHVALGLHISQLAHHYKLTALTTEMVHALGQLRHKNLMLLIEVALVICLTIYWAPGNFCYETFI